jgi:serine/threonine protein kinase
MADNDEKQEYIQDGGKLLDIGMYGCVFKPQIQCKGKQPLDENGKPFEISKLILREDAEHEYSISNTIRSIPLSKNYFAVAESICEPSAKQSDPNIKSCFLIQNYPMNDLRLLSMPYAGISISSFKFNINTFTADKWMNFITHLLEAGAILALFGLVHRDLHDGNILIDNRYIPRIIDFNLMIRTNQVLASTDLSHGYDHTLMQEPPDSTLVNAMYNTKDARTVINDIVYKKPIIKTIRALFNTSQQEMHEELTEFYYKSKSASNGNLVEWFKSYWRTVDSWAIACNIIHLIDIFSVHKEFSKITHNDTITHVLKQMTRVSPLHRIDCVQALAYIKPSSFIIRKYATNWLNKVGRAF